MNCIEGEKNKLAFTPRSTELKAVDQPTCRRMLGGLEMRLVVHELRENHICALHEECSVALCNGDSGGPLTMRKKKGNAKYDNRSTGGVSV